MKLKAFIAGLSVLLLIDAGFAIPANKRADSVVHAAQSSKDAMPSDPDRAFYDRYGNAYTMNGFVTYITPKGCKAIARFIKQDRALIKAKPFMALTNEGDRYRNAIRQYKIFCAPVKPVPIIFGGIGK